MPFLLPATLLAVNGRIFLGLLALVALCYAFGVSVGACGAPSLGLSEPELALFVRLRLPRCMGALVEPTLP